MEQEVKISKKAIRGFRIKNGRLYKFTKDGRKRKNWKSHYRKLSKKHLKDKCENRRCSTIHNLTIHHKIPLSSAKSEKDLIKLCGANNCQTLCKTCHEELEHRITLERNGKAKKKKKFKKKIARILRKKAKKVIVSEEKSLLVLEETEWGGYRIID